MWECFHCNTKFSNPEAMGKHTKSTGHTLETLNPNVRQTHFGWQGFEISGYPKTPDGRALWIDAEKPESQQK